ncbi:MAG: hypothetical protein ACI85O_001215 [Saprospiraceae bacterium]|jgi:hypothetical protein
MGKRKRPKVLTIEELEKKGTKELLGYLKRLHRCEESFELSDMDENPELSDVETIYFKQTEKWRTAYIDAKSILETRKHIEK